MQLLSIQVGKVQTHDYNGSEWTTGYVKTPVTGRVFVGKLNIAGDEQHNTKVHGGEHRAVLMYGVSNYEVLRAEVTHPLPYGSFGENFTVSGMDEDTVCIGDVYQIGDTVRVQVSQPRQPCNNIYKHLGIRGIVNRLDNARRTGWYLRVLQEGEVEAGMPIERVAHPHPQWTIMRAHDVMDNRINATDAAGELAAVMELEPRWRDKLAQAAARG